MQKIVLILIFSWCFISLNVPTKESSLSLKQSMKGDELNSQVNKPNFILIVADDLGFADLSLNGSTQIKTPSIETRQITAGCPEELNTCA